LRITETELVEPLRFPIHESGSAEFLGKAPQLAQ